MISFSLFVVDDEEFIRDAALMNLGQYDVKAFATAEDAISAAKKQAPDLVLLDVGLPGMSGVDALAEMRAICPETLFIMITAYEDVDTVVKAMKRGAYDYVVKPLHMDSLKNNIANALESVRLRKQVRLLHQRYLEENLPCFIGESKQIQTVMDFVGKVAAAGDASVLIRGETGTGKELIAGAIHFKSPNFRGNLVTVNCAAIPRELIESELFGYESGAFSGAKSGGKRGLIEGADGGTLFLDEVGDLGPEAQAKLLRFFGYGRIFQGRRHQASEGQSQGCLGHQPRPGGHDRQRRFQAGFVLSFGRGARRCAFSGKAARGHPTHRQPLPGGAWR